MCMQESIKVVKDIIKPGLFDYLQKDFSATKVYNAIKQMKSTSAPGPDGLHALFYHSFWDIVGPDVTRFVLNILNNYGDPGNINQTLLCLIPKIKNPNLPTDYRPIALCNVILKIVTKTIANRIKSILPTIISPQQSAFVPGRLILDNTILAYEAFHFLKNHKNKKKGVVGIKLDMEKAYDRVEWNFLETTMLTMGFPPKLVSTIMKCVKSVTFSVLINGQPSKVFKPQRGIRHGDPLSPYLFIICAEVLSGLISFYQDQGKIHGITIAKNAPSISHLFFVDDNMVFCRANKIEAKYLMDIFAEYQRISGQKINLSKSEMVFSPNIMQNVKNEFQSFMPIQITEKISKYLRLPTQIGRSKNQIFNFIMDRVKSKLKGWKERNLSFARRRVLIRAVIQAIPTYVMSVFLIPQGICDKIEKAICRFWWGGNEDKRKIHWKNKDFLFRSKHQGRQGFRTMRSFNEALLAKQVWRLHKHPTSLLVLCLKPKYYRHTDILKARLGNIPSYVWSSIYNAQWVVKKGGCWRIGDGHNINIWDDNWLPKQNGFKVLSQIPTPTTVSNVKDLLDDQHIEWKHEILGTHFHWFEQEQMHQIPFIKETTTDSYMWMYTRDVHYTMKFGYNTIREWHQNKAQGTSNSNAITTFWKKFWNINTIPRHNDLLWRILNDSIPTKCALNTKGIRTDMFCPRCSIKLEDLNHTFMNCIYARKVWFGSNLSIKFPEEPEYEFKDWLHYLISTADAETIIYAASTIYNIWFARNKIIFENK